MDNASFHKGPKIKEFCYENNINVILNQRYEPDFNMIELVFAFLKVDFYSQNFYTE